jgi:hypothetical protein
MEPPYEPSQDEIDAWEEPPLMWMRNMPSLCEIGITIGARYRRESWACLC